MEPTRVSKLLFGRPARLPVAAWVRAHDKRFFQSEPPMFGTTSKTNIKEELLRLVDAGMLLREETGDGKVWYEMIDNPLWDVIDAAVVATGLAWVDDRLVTRDRPSDRPGG